MSKVHVTYHGECRQCDETGDVYAWVEKHAKAIGHTVWWVGRPS